MPTRVLANHRPPSRRADQQSVGDPRVARDGTWVPGV